MRVVVKSAVVVILITFLGSYLSFKVQKSQNDMLYNAKYYQIFTGYSSDRVVTSGNDEIVDYLVTGSTNADLQEIRPTVLISAAGTFLLGLFVGYKIYTKEKYRKIKQKGPNLDSGMENTKQKKSVKKSEYPCPACGHDNTFEDLQSGECGDCGLSLG